jgi:transcription elongation factor Elf1
MERKTFISCDYCKGTGQVIAEIPEIPAQGELPAVPAHDGYFECPECGGEKVMIQSFYKGATDNAGLLDKINDVMDKCNDIKEKVDEINEKVDKLLG